MEPKEAPDDVVQLRSVQDRNLIVTFQIFCKTILSIGKHFQKDTVVRDFLGSITNEWETFLRVSAKPKYWKGYEVFYEMNEIVHPDTSAFLHGCINLMSINRKIMVYITEKCNAWPWLLSEINRRLAQEKQILEYLIQPHVTQQAPTSADCSSARSTETVSQRTGRELLELMSELRKHNEKTRTHVSSPAQISKIRK
jgi:hypothetical protein